MSGTTTFVWRNGHRTHRLGLFPLWPQWVRVWEQWLHSTGTCVTTMGHIIVLNSQRVQRSQRLVSFDRLISFDWVREVVTFDWVKWLVSLLLSQVRLISFEWVISFLRFVPAAIRYMPFGHRESQKIKEQWIYFPDQSLMYERFRKEKIDLVLKFVEFTKKQKRSQVKPRNHEEAKIQRLRNATQTYYCDVSRWRRFGTEPQPLFPISRTRNMHRLPKNTQNSQRLN